MTLIWPDMGRGTGNGASPAAAAGEGGGSLPRRRRHHDVAMAGPWAGGRQVVEGERGAARDALADQVAWPRARTR